MPLLYGKTWGRELWRYIIQEKSLEWLVWKHIESRVKGEINSIRNMQDNCTARSQCILGNGFTHSVQSLGQTHPVSDWISTLKNKQYNHRKVGCPPVWWQRIPIAAPAKWKSAQISFGVIITATVYLFIYLFFHQSDLECWMKQAWWYGSLLLSAVMCARTFHYYDIVMYIM